MGSSETAPEREGIAVMGNQPKACDRADVVLRDLKEVSCVIKLI